VVERERERERVVERERFAESERPRLGAGRSGALESRINKTVASPLHTELCRPPSCRRTACLHVSPPGSSAATVATTRPIATRVPGLEG